MNLWIKPNRIIIYKYLSLNTCTKRQRFLHILKTGEIRFSKFHAPGDPMEGIYCTYAPEEIKQLFASEKNNYLIGCFGKSDRNHLLWAYYADGYSGACVELEIPKDSNYEKRFDLVDIEYVNKEQFNDAINLSNENIRKVLTRKLLSWKNENELRLLAQKNIEPGAKGVNIKIGTVTSVSFGINIPKEALSFLESTVKLLVESGDQVIWRIKEPTEAIQLYDTLQQSLDKLNGYKLWRAGFSV